MEVYGTKESAERGNKKTKICRVKERQEMDMRINGFCETNAQAGTIGLMQENDPVSKRIQNQIANAQETLQSLSANEEMSAEDKMKKRQEIRQEITKLNQQLRQHQIEQRRQQQREKSSAEEEMTGSKNTSAGKGTGLSQAGMEAMIRADSSVKQAKAQGSVATQMAGRAGVLASEIKQDKGSGANTEKKEAELAEYQAKAQSAMTAQMSSLAQGKQSIKEVTKTNSRTETREERVDQTEKNEKKPEAAENGNKKPEIDSSSYLEYSTDNRE